MALLSQQLYDLIQSLNKSEKRSFKIDATRHGGEQKKYLKLFSILENLPSYSKRALKEALSDNDYTSTNLSSEFNYLQDQIIATLKQIRRHNTPDNQARELHETAILLLERGMHSQAASAVQKAKKICEEAELVLYLPSINLLARKISGGESGFDLERSAHENHLAIQTLSNFDMFDAAYRRALQLRHRLFYKNDISAKEELLNLAKIYAPSDTSASSPKSKIKAYEIAGILANVEGDPQAEYDAMLACIGLLDRNEKFKAAHLFEYYTFQIHLLRISKSINLELYKNQFVHILSQAKKISADQVYLKHRMLIFAYSTESARIVESHDYADSEPVISAIEKLLTRAKKQMSEDIRINFYYKVALIYFFKKDYDASLTYINNILSKSARNRRFDIIKNAKLLEWMVHFELKNVELLPYQLRSLENQMKSYKAITKAGKGVVKTMKQLLRYAQFSRATHEWAAFKEILEKYPLKELRKDSYYFDFHHWAKLKERQ